MPESFKVWNGKVIQSELRPLVTENHNGELEIVANLYAVKSITNEAKTAVDALSNVLPYVSQAIILQRGDMLLFDNSKCLHGRAAISQNGDRWLQRLFCRRSLMDIRRATDCNSGFIFDVKFLVLE
ncbi:MAG: TauD/TfdA family dioxygenase [Trichodesmium sp. MO_231.B1]|nr:TauD/TfdA family dioxygenase [Trichodesmium sp. MO_231.B1]